MITCQIILNFDFSLLLNLLFLLLTESHYRLRNFAREKKREPRLYFTVHESNTSDSCLFLMSIVILYYSTVWYYRNNLQRPHCSENKHSTWRQEFLGRGSENLQQSTRLTAAA